MEKDHPFIAYYEEDVFIVNPTELVINHLVYSTKSVQFFDGDIIHSSRPFFQIENIPERSMVKIEDFDPYEDGSVIYYLEEFECVDEDEKTDFRPFTMDKKRFKRKTIFRKDGSAKFTKVEREKSNIKTNPSYVIDEDGEVKYYDE